MEVKSQRSQDIHIDSKYEDLTDEITTELKEDNYLESIRKLKFDLVDKSSECELLKIKLDHSRHEVDSLSRELNECKLNMFERNEDSKKKEEETKNSRKLEEDYVKLMSEFLNLAEKSDLYKQNLYDNLLTKSNAINNFECLASNKVYENQLKECKLELDNRLSELNLAMAKIRNSEEENVSKDKTINELKKALDDAKVTHKHEITVLEEYIQSLKNTISSYERTLSNYIEQKSDDNHEGNTDQ